MKYILSTIFLIFALGQLKAQEERKYVREGNDHFSSEKYLESEIEYRKALDKDKESFEAQFNLGDALFKQEKYDEALDQFQILAETEKDPNRLAQVYHNIGNGYMATQKLPEAIEAYKNALRNNPADNDTRYNLIAAQKMLQQQQQQQQQNKDQQDQNQNQDQNQQQQQQQQQDSDNDGIPDEKEQQDQNGNQNKNQDTDNDGIPDYQDQDSDNDGRSDKEEAGQDPKNPQDTDNDGTPDYRDLDSNNNGVPDKDEPQDQNKNQQQQQQQQQQPQDQMSKEDAQRLLNAIEQDEKALQEKLRKAKASQRSKTEKNW